MVKRIKELDGIRAIAIAAVFLHHILHVKLLWMGVDLFFVLSGFLITGVLLDRKANSLKEYLGHFYRRRAQRILPPYLLLLLVTTIVVGTIWIREWYYYFFLMNVITATGAPQPGSLSILWSLAVEEQFYLVWPFVVYYLSDAGIAWVAGGMAIAAPLLRWLCTPLFATHWAIYALTPFRMDTLAVGALLALVWRTHPEKIRRFGQYGPLISMCALGVLGILAGNPEFRTRANTHATNVLIYEMSLIICTGIIFWALSGRWVRVLTLAPVRYLGRVSYTVYLIHLTFYFVLTRYLHNTVWINTLTLAGALLYAAVSWFVMEKPILTAKPRPAPLLEKTLA